VKTPAEELLEKKLEARGTGGATTLYAMYLQWHVRQAIKCGFDVETEVLRIPSSRNWAVIGRRRVPTSSDEDKDFKTIALSMIEEVRERGIFKTRKPEGKAGLDHH